MELRSSQFRPFLVGAIKPRGWLKNQLELQAAGLSGFLGEVFPDVGKASGWLGGPGESWERGPYYLDGILPLSILTENGRLWDIAQSFIEWTLNSQERDGFFGPKNNCDWWPRMVMLKALITYADLVQDKTQEFICKYLKYQKEKLQNQPLSRWAKARGFENLIPIFWLYDRTKKAWLLDLAQLINNQTLDWVGFFLDIPYKEKMTKYLDFPNIDWALMDKENDVKGLELFDKYFFSHVVNVAMAAKAPWLYFKLDGSSATLKATYSGIDNVMRYHGTANYLFTGDEHLAGTNPSQGTELCAVVELMYSLEHLLLGTGLAKFGNHLEKLAYNALPAALAPDLWSHQYDQQTNQISCIDAPHLWINNSSNANTFGLDPNYGCCTVNYHQGWPKFALHLWLRAEDGLVLAMYAPSEITYQTAEGVTVVITEETEYPFRDEIALTFSMSQPTKFKLYLREIEGYKKVKFTLKGEALSYYKDEKGYLVLDRKWMPGDKLAIAWELELQYKYWQNNSVSVERGSLVFALPLGEKWVKVGGVSPASNYEVYPQKDWNYGLLAEAKPKVNFGDVTLQPFNCNKPPVIVSALGKKVYGWTEEKSSAGPIPENPVALGETEEVNLIPYGGAKLRITQFPILK